MSSPRKQEAGRVCASTRLNPQKENTRVAAEAAERDRAAEVPAAREKASRAERR